VTPEILLGALVRVTHDDPCAFGVVAACLLPAVRRRVRQYGPSLEREDALIAATAIEKRLPLMTRNWRHFRQVAGIRLYSGA